MRQLAGQPSIDCLVQRARLRYIRRLLTNERALVLALLCARPKGKMLDWAKQSRADMTVLIEANPDTEMPNIEAQLTEWQFFASQEDKWNNCVQKVFFTSSVCDRSVTLQNISSNGIAHQGFVCYLCDISVQGTLPSFPNTKDLKQHQRIKHKIKNMMRYFADADGVCHACGTLFHTRLRLLAHLSDNRRTACHDKLIRYDGNRLSDVRVHALDLLDRTARRQAQQAGHSHVLAVGHARSQRGCIVGRASR